MSAALPVTERANPKSQAIDVATPREIISILKGIDQEIFDGWSDVRAAFVRCFFADNDPSAIEAAKQTLASMIQNDNDVNATFILSGCGTSGRIAWMTARRMNQLLKAAGKRQFARYLIASGDSALLIGQEQGEDDPHKAEVDIDAVVSSIPSHSPHRLLYIGITCGLSAPYVASQLHYLMTKTPAHIEVTGVMLGFNPIELARNIPVEGWNNRTVRDVVMAMKAHQPTRNMSFMIINPIIGPEAITGSSRMKGGSATKVILDAIMYSALAAGAPEWWTKIHPSLPTTPSAFIAAYKATVQQFYENEAIEDLGKLIQRAAESLWTGKGGHLYYVCTDPSLAILAIIDASECPPTYGSHLDEVRAFVAGGWRDLSVASGDLSPLSPHYCISLEHFKERVQPTLTSMDTVVLITSDSSDASDFLRSLQQLSQPPFIALLRIATTPPPPPLSTCNLSISFVLSSLGGVDAPCFQELALKLALNAVTTGAHVIKGKIFENRMIDVRISNNKLLYRAIGIVAKCAKVSEQEARTAILKAIHQTDVLTPAMIQAADSEVISVGFKTDLVVPRSILIASNKYSVVEATELVKKEPVVAKIMRRPQ